MLWACQPYRKGLTVVWGYKAGNGVDIWRILVDPKYEGTFETYHNNNVNVPNFVDGAFKTPTSSDVKDGRPTTSI